MKHLKELSSIFDAVLYSEGFDSALSGSSLNVRVSALLLMGRAQITQVSNSLPSLCVLSCVLQSCLVWWMTSSSSCSSTPGSPGA